VTPLINQIICGDNVATMATFPGDCIDLTVTSPPYGELRTYGGHSWDFEGVAQQLWRVTKLGGVVVWVVADQTIDGSESGESFRQALRFKEIGFRLHDTMIWQKKSCYSHDPRNKRYKTSFEYMFVLSKGDVLCYNEIKDVPNINAGRTLSGTKGRKASGELRKLKPVVLGKFQARSNIWNAAIAGTPIHPAQFPEALARDHILSWSNEGDIVLDPFAGSGTTCRKAKDLGRKWIAIEVNPSYCEIIRKRMAQEVLAFTGDLDAE